MYNLESFSHPNEKGQLEVIVLYCTEPSNFNTSSVALEYQLQNRVENLAWQGFQTCFEAGIRELPPSHALAS